MSNSLIDLIQQLRDKVEPVIGTTTLADIQENAADPLTIITVCNLAGLADLYRKVDGIKGCFNPANASCEDLPLIALLMGAPDFQPSSSKAPIIIRGASGTSIPQGTQYSDQSGRIWRTLSTVILIGETGFTEVESAIGSFSLDVGTLSLSLPIDGVSFSTNTALASLGYQERSCEELREYLTRLKPNWKVLETRAHVESELWKITGVTHVEFIPLAPACLSPDGCQRHAFIIDGGDSQLISEVLLQSSPINALTLVGNTSGDQGVKFIRRCPVGIHVNYCGLSVDTGDIASIICEGEVHIGQVDFINRIKGLAFIQFRAIYDK